MTLEIPELLEKALGDTPEESRRRALECVVVEGYKNKRLSHGKVQELLGLSWHQTEALLHRYGAMLHMTSDEGAEEVEAMVAMLELK